MNPALRPKLAGTLILTRTRRDGVEVLMGRRSDAHVFMPRRYVFPGGRVDRADAFAPAATELCAACLDPMTRILPERRARAAAAAAVRETAEETGLLVARPAPIASRHPAWKPFRDRGLSPDLSALTLVARAITPPGRVRRFDAWFFQADAEAAHGDLSGAEGLELEDLRWVTPEAALGLALPQVTRFVLAELQRLAADPEAGPRHIRELARAVRIDPI